MDGFNFKFYGQIDVKRLQQKIADAALDWDEFSFRQERYKPHRKTKTIPLIFNERNLSQPKYWDNYDIFRNEIEYIQFLIEKTDQCKGTLCSAAFINLPARSRINAHTDSNDFFDVCKRIHVPIVTNPDCLFTVDGETINMKEGEIWEINNGQKWHRVINNGDAGRIHLMMDWRPETIPA